MTDFDLLLIAVRPDYQDKGVTALIFNEMAPYFDKYGIKRVETTAILETNSKSLANFADLERIQHKRRRAYIKAI
jgi:GNAT superfamily N-acetyltransferase